VELTETISSLNQQLVDAFGLDTSTNQSIFRIVWSDDETEKRMVSDIGGIHLLYPEIREVKKYPYVKGMYILERLVLVPYYQRHELADVKLSYEPIWTFCDKAGNYLPPTWPACKFVVDTLYAALGKKSLAKYAEDTGPEQKEERIKKISDELFGNETDVGDALAHKAGVVVPSNYKEH
jgi:hypothetical protein